MLENFGLLKKRINVALEEIISGEKSNQIAKIDREILRLNAPKLYAKLEISQIQDFEKMCVVVSKYSNKDPKKMTVLEYFQTIETIKEQSKKKK